MVFKASLIHFLSRVWRNFHMAYNNSRNPLRSLQRRIGEHISIRLKDGVKYIGILKEYDNFMNMILTDALELFEEKEIGKFEEIFIRGNNVLFIEPEAIITDPKEN